MDSLYGTIVVKCGIPPDYFMDIMSQREMVAVLNAYYDQHKEGWEKIRMTNHAIVAVQSTKPIKPIDVMVFPWDKDVAVKSIERPSKERFDELKKKFLNI